MKFLKNKHIVLATVIAPVLAIIAYLATDYVVSEPPQRAQQGQTYKLAASSNCRYQSGMCTLKNGDVEVHLQAERLDEKSVKLTLNSTLDLQKPLVSIATGENASPPIAMQQLDEGDGWQLQVDVNQPELSTVRLALGVAGSTYYAETPAVFIDYVTTFSRENFSSAQ